MTTSAWHQANIGIAGDGVHRAGVAHELFSRLVPALDRRGDHVGGAPTNTGRWFFQRKPPGIRLRIECGDGDNGSVATAVESILDRAAHDGLVREWFWSDYEPEVERFGGAIAMDVAHDHFATDAAVWRAADQALRDPANAAADETELRHRLDVVFAVAAGALVHRIAGDAAAARAVGIGLAHLTSDPLIELRALLTTSERRDPPLAIRRWLPTGASALVALIAQSADLAFQAAARLDPATDRAAFGALLVHFDANRWGVDGGGQRWMADTMFTGFAATTNDEWP